MAIDAGAPAIDLFLNAGAPAIDLFLDAGAPASKATAAAKQGFRPTA